MLVLIFSLNKKTDFKSRYIFITFYDVYQTLSFQTCFDSKKNHSRKRIKRAIKSKPNIIRKRERERRISESHCQCSLNTLTSLMDLRDHRAGFRCLLLASRRKTGCSCSAVPTPPCHHATSPFQTNGISLSTRCLAQNLITINRSLHPPKGKANIRGKPLTRTRRLCVCVTLRKEE